MEDPNQLNSAIFNRRLPTPLSWPGNWVPSQASATNPMRLGLHSMPGHSRCNRKKGWNEDWQCLRLFTFHLVIFFWILDNLLYKLLHVWMWSNVWPCVSFQRKAYAYHMPIHQASMFTDSGLGISTSKRKSFTCIDTYYVFWPELGDLNRLNSQLSEVLSISMVPHGAT